MYPVPLAFFKISFLSIPVCSYFWFCFFVSSNKPNSISCGICLSFKSKHLQLFYKIIIQLSSTGIFLGLWSKVPPCNFTEQLFFLHSCEWLLPITKIISAIKKLGRWKIKKWNIKSRTKIKVTRLLKFLSRFFRWLECVLLGKLQVPNPLQYRFKTFSGETWRDTDQNGVCFFSNYL